MARAMDAHLAFIYVRGEFIRERQRLEAAVEQAYEAKLIGKGINVMISPLPKSKRAKHPHGEHGPAPAQNGHVAEKPKVPAPGSSPAPAPASFANNPFAQLETKTAS